MVEQMFAYPDIAMTLESTLSGWTGPSSDTEQDKQDRTERMIRDAVRAQSAFDDCSLSVYPKGSYANNTNVRADSDVDVAVQCHEAFYYDQEVPDAGGTITPYSGTWTPQKLRSELVAALQAKFPGQVETSGSTAIGVNSSTARVDADVVPRVESEPVPKEKLWCLVPTGSGGGGEELVG